MNMEIPMIDLPGNLTISNKFADDEKPSQAIKINYPKLISKDSTHGDAFHEKSEKNKKVNSGSPSKKRQRVYSKSGKLKYKKGR